MDIEDTESKGYHEKVRTLPTWSFMSEKSDIVVTHVPAKNLFQKIYFFYSLDVEVEHHSHENYSMKQRSFDAGIPSEFKLDAN